MNTPPNHNNNSNAGSHRDQIHRILTEFGLDPSDYLFNPADEQPQAQSPSAFSKYASPRTTVSSRPLAYAQQPPPPPPVINRQASASHDMSQRAPSTRRTPPPPPTGQGYDPHSSNPALSAEDYLRQINALDNPPVKVVKPNTENLVYRKEIRIRYLQPPTPPPPAPIIIREKQAVPEPPESPLLIRERKPEARTPPPLTIRERPPSPPPMLEPYIVDKPLPAPPAQPRQIIIERLPTPPPKPRTVIFEKWLPYKKVKRPVLLQKASPLPPVNPTRNVIIEYEPLRAYTVRRVIEEGIFRVDPEQYAAHNTHADGDVRIVERIDDLPPPSEELMRVLNSYNQSSQDDAADQLTDVSRTSSAPARARDGVLSPGRDASFLHSQSKNADKY